MINKKCVSFLKKEDAQYNSSLKSFVKSFPVTVNGYTFTEVLGWGSFAVVAKAHHSGYNCDFAAKIIPEKDSVDHTSEMRILQSLCHPNIIKVYASFNAFKNLFFIILQYCKNGTLKKEIKPSVGLPYNLLVSYMKQILEALQYLHLKKIIHRDIKTANIFIDNYGRPLLGDFGLSFMVEDEGNLCSEYSGALLYRAPELLLKQPHDPFKSDIWSLGVVFYIMAVGTEPWSLFNRDAMRNSIINAQFTIPDTVNPEIADIIRSMLTADSNKRAEIADILQSPIFKAPSLLKAKSVRHYSSSSQLPKFVTLAKHSSAEINRSRSGFKNAVLPKQFKT